MRKLFNILFRESEVDRDFDEVSKKVKAFRNKLQIEMLNKPTKKTSPSNESLIEDITFVKNEWVRLPEAFGNGVISMGMEATEKRKAFLVHYEPDSEIFTHSHPHNLERIQVLTGYIQDNSTGKVIPEGKTYLIDKNEEHNIVTKDKEAYLFIVFSEEVDTLTVNHLIK
jgi:quercetin dioxygenase-like cupin family protein